jgi:hypothetical protein
MACKDIETEYSLLKCIRAFPVDKIIIHFNPFEAIIYLDARLKSWGIRAKLNSSSSDKSQAM